MRAMLTIAQGPLWQTVKKTVAKLQNSKHLQQSDENEASVELTWLEGLTLFDSLTSSETNTGQNSNKTDMAFFLTDTQLLSLLDPENEDSALQGHKDVFLTLPSVTFFIAELLKKQDKVNIQEATSQWVQVVKTLVGIRKKQRNRIKLLLLDDLATQLNLQFPQILSRDELSTSMPLDSFLLASSLHYQADKELQSTNTLLEISCLPLVENPDESLNVQQYLETYCQSLIDRNKLVDENTTLAIEISNLKSDLDQTKLLAKESTAKTKRFTEENELLIQQLHVVQESLEQHLNKNQQESTVFEQKINSIQKESDTLRTELKKAQDGLDTNKKENKKLSSLLLASEKSLESQISTSEELKKESEKKLVAIKKENDSSKKELEKKLASLKKENEVLKSSLKKAETELKEEKSKNKDYLDQNKYVAEENELLIQQLHIVQESLEESFHKDQEQSKRQAQIGQNLEKSRAESDVLRAENDELKHALQQTQEKLENALISNKVSSSKESQKQIQALTNENKELVQQLKLAQESLEAPYLETQGAGEPSVLKSIDNTVEENKESDNSIEDAVFSEHLLASSLAFNNDFDISVDKDVLEDVSLSSVANLLESSDLEHRDQKELEENIALIAASEYFDAIWYLTEYPDISEANMNPAEHYLLFGYLEGRSPSAKFDGEWYLNNNSDVASEQVNPLLHYEKFGKKEGRIVSYLDCLV